MLDNDFEISKRWLQAYRRDAIESTVIPRIVIPLDWLWRYAKALGWELNENLFIEAECFARARTQRLGARDSIASIRGEAERGQLPPT